MPGYSQNKAARQPFGKNVYLRSVRDIKTESFTFYKGGIPVSLVDGSVKAVTNKVITANIATLTAAAHGFVVGETVFVSIGDAAFDGFRVVATVPDANNFTFVSGTATVGTAATTGTATGGSPSQRKILQPGSVIAKITSGAGSGMVGVFQAGVSDGRQTTSNIVGVNDTFLPWELDERDADIAVVYEATCVQAWCFEYNAAGVAIPLSNTTRDAIIALPAVALLFK